MEQKKYVSRIGKTNIIKHNKNIKNIEDMQKGGNIMIGGNMTMGGMCFQKIMNILAPMGKIQLISVIGLLVMNYYKRWNKKQSGGMYFNNMEKILIPMDKNLLLIIGTLLLFNYILNIKKNNQKGGTKLNNKLEELIKYNCNECKVKFNQTGGNLINNIYNIIIPYYNGGINMFAATSLIIILNELFMGKKTQKGGEIMEGKKLFNSIDELLKSLGINKKINMKGGNYNYIIGKQPLEVVGDKALNYSKDLKQFGCKIPEWGYNLRVNGPCGQTHCI